jgi:hypothetical protein
VGLLTGRECKIRAQLDADYGGTGYGCCIREHREGDEEEVGKRLFAMR